MKRLQSTVPIQNKMAEATQTASDINSVSISKKYAAEICQKQNLLRYGFKYNVKSNKFCIILIQISKITNNDKKSHRRILHLIFGTKYSQFGLNYNTGT